MLTRAQRTHAEFGQSLWYDNIQRSLLADGEFARLVASGVRGCTSNPAIFQKAICGSKDYDGAIRMLAREGMSAKDAYVALAVADVRQAADVFRGVYEESRCADGYVSIEVSPDAAHDAAATVREARSLVEAIGRDNLMIKVPGTDAGVQALEELLAEGISVNVTLLFSRARYRAVAEAYIRGLERAAARGVALHKVDSVASFFVSRIDSVVDTWLNANAPAAVAERLRGKIAIANAKLAYADFEQLFNGERFQKLRELGARPQRLLWASTGTKNPAYPDTLYVDSLIGRETVNTIPPETLAAFQDHGTVGSTLTAGRDVAKAQLEELASAGFDLDAATERLLIEGLKAFDVAMASLLQALAAQLGSEPTGGAGEFAQATSS